MKVDCWPSDQVAGAHEIHFHTAVIGACASRKTDCYIASACLVPTDSGSGPAERKS